MIAACYVVFNEAELIAESVRSAKAYVDKFIFVDSAFTANPLDVTHSTDATRELAEAAAAPVPVTYVESDTKLDIDAARNLSLSLVPPKGWALTIDGDETILGDRRDVAGLFDDIRNRTIRAPTGISVFTAALRFDGHAPAISEEQYGLLPMIYTRGVQPRLVPAKGAEWHRVPHGRSYGLYVNGTLARGPVDPRMVIVNHRTRQTFGAYQNDYQWESAL